MQTVVYLGQPTAMAQMCMQAPFYLGLSTIITQMFMNAAGQTGCSTSNNVDILQMLLL
jgi:hypothetical protein